jgi:macrolide transport system ATP-binding/permease protein
MEFIRLVDVTKTYRIGEVDLPVLKGVSLTIQRGEYVALMGASGSGKTTLMNLLGCLDRPTQGEYWFDGREISRLASDRLAELRGRSIGFVFQNFHLLPRTSALDNVVMPLQYAERPISYSAEARLGSELLRRVGLADRLDHEPSQLSGGQQQRVAVARALVNRPPLLLADEPTGNLDSRTSREILRLFDELHAEGMTIVLVTHDPNVARCASRIVEIQDGLVAGDSAAGAGGKTNGRPLGAWTASSGGGGVATATRPQISAASQAAAAAPLPRARRRLLPRTLRTALDALRRNVVRSSLTTLGIVIGVAAVIAMMEIGQGSKTALEQTIASMGANTLLVLPGAASSGGVTFGAGSEATLTPQDAEEIAEHVAGVAFAAPIVRARTQAVRGKLNWVPAFIYGTTPEFLDVRDWTELSEGEMFTDKDVRNAGKVCVVGQTIVRELFAGESPLGLEIRIQNVPFRVIGVLGRKGANMMGLDQDDVILAPWTTVKNRVAGVTLATVNQSQGQHVDTTQKVNSISGLYPGSSPLYPIPSPSQQANTPQPVRIANIDQILLKASSDKVVPEVMEQVQSLLRDRHRIRPGEADDFNVRDMAEMMNALSSATRLMSGLLLAVALISLVVGGVGIMNIMLVSVIERTREVGLRMAVGAKQGRILQQFLTESIVLCLLGGAVGILLGGGASLLVRTLLKWPTETSVPAVLAAVAVSAAVGIVFGYYPAWKASRLNPIDALRHE